MDGHIFSLQRVTSSPTGLISLQQAISVSSNMFWARTGLEQIACQWTKIVRKLQISVWAAVLKGLRIFEEYTGNAFIPQKLDESNN
jgi:hypothetical protein